MTQHHRPAMPVDFFILLHGDSYEGTVEEAGGGEEVGRVEVSGAGGR